jgi:hypothetical protein
LYFGPFRQILSSNWTETESRPSHVTHFSKKPEFTPSPRTEIPNIAFGPLTD